MSEVQDSVGLEEIVDWMDSRANVYRLLSRCFASEVDAALAQELARGFVLESDNAMLSAEVDAMKATLSGIDDSGLEMLAVTFDRVFFGMGPLTAHHAFPYESVYTSDRAIMMQQAYSQVVAAYREQRLAKDASFKEPEDHIAVELAFMATLAQRCALLLRQGEEDAAVETVAQQLAFLLEHLLSWTDRFSADLRRAAGEGFYFHLAQFAQLFMEEDAALLAELLEG